MEIRNLTLAYGGGTPALQNVSLTVGRGEIASLVGESGSGKTSLLHAVMSLSAPAAEISGGILFRGAPVTPALRGAQIGMVFQNAGQYADPIMRIGRQFDEMLLVHGIKSRQERRRIAEEALSVLAFPEPARILRAYPFELSGGMMQRAAIAMAISLRPPLLLADEPTSSLDADTQQQVVSQLASLNRRFGTAILLVTHSMGVAGAVSDRIFVLHRGQIVESGTAGEILRAPKDEYTRRLVQAYTDWET